MPHIAIDRERSAGRIERDVETLGGPDYTTSAEAIRRYAYILEYRNTLDYFTRAFQAIGFEVSEDPVGTLVARNRPRGERVFGIGSHCDSNRNGGKWDGTMGVVTALEVCRLSVEHGLDLGLQAIAFLEEEGSGFGQMLLGSRIMAQHVSEEDLRERFRAIDDGRSFWEHAQDAGYPVERWRESAHVLDDLTGWIEMHIEQARVLQDTGNRIGIVTGIAGYVHGDIAVEGRADHAGGTPMGGRLDAGTVAAECILELERLATAAGRGTVGTVGEIAFEPSLINVIPGRARFSLDIRGTDEEAFRGVARDIAAFAEATAKRRGMTARWAERQTLAPTPSDPAIVAALEAAATATGEPFLTMPSGAAHDSMAVADRAPIAMVFVPCLDGISHSPAEVADPADGALAAEIILNAIAALQ
ncbi:MAG: M20 family metallo-hydrolase [Actinobacteria bacterium]|nr:M20 family metallo-hydrolase [Actinomycetota bacterium]